MAEEVIFADGEMLGTSFEEGMVLSLGTRFHITEAGAASRARYFCPASGAGGSVLMRLWRVSDSTVLATASFPSPVAGAWNEADWTVSAVPTLVDLTPDVEYQTAYTTPNRYVATTDYFGWPKSSAGGRVVSSNPGGYFSVSGTAMPDQLSISGIANYYADTVIYFEDGMVEVTASFDLRWRVLEAVQSATDLRWRVLNSVSKATELSWKTYSRTSKMTSIFWNTEGETYVYTAPKYTVDKTDSTALARRGPEGPFRVNR